VNTKIKCKIHGEQFYLMAKLAGASVCAGCVADNLFVPEICEQIEADYPAEMRSTRASLGLPRAVIRPKRSIIGA